MCPLADGAIDKNRYILMYDDESVMDAVIALRDAGGQDWWHLVVDVEGGGYAVGRFADLGQRLETEGAAVLQQTLGELVGTVLKPVEVVVEREAVDLGEAQDRAYDSGGKAAVVLEAGAVRGLVLAGVTRGVFDTKLVALAGEYAEIPEKGTLSRRRREAMSKKKEKTPPDEAATANS
jgi:hypothetical protein